MSTILVILLVLAGAAAIAVFWVIGLYNGLVTFRNRYKNSFSQIDVPRASILLAQATGRLIRNASDRGVVAVLDPRLGKASYRWDIVKALPPMQRTRHRAEAEAFLREITGTGAPTTEG